MTGRWSASVSRDTARLVASSDGVFAITITLLVLEIKPPTDDSNLLHDLLALWPSYLAWLPIPDESPGHPEETSA